MEQGSGAHTPQLPDQYIDQIDFGSLHAYARPLDLLVFQGKTFVEKWILKAQQRSYNIGHWTHVGIVFPAQFIAFPNRKDGELYIWEAVISGFWSDGVPSVETGRAYFGIQIRNLRDVLAANHASGSHIGILRLKRNPLQEQQADESVEECRARVANALGVLSEIMDRFHGRPFDCNVMNCLAAAFPQFYHFSSGPFKDKQQQAFFCSEFATFLYQRLGLLPSRLNPQLITPQELISCTGDLSCVAYEDMWEDTIFLVRNVNTIGNRQSGDSTDSGINIQKAKVKRGKKEWLARDNQYRVELEGVEVEPRDGPRQLATAEEFFRSVSQRQSQNGRQGVVVAQSGPKME